MCPYTLDHNKMLASTMQHSTHHHTPNPTQPPPHPHRHHEGAHHRDALDGHGPEAATRKNNPPTGKMSSQDPTVCRTRSRFLALCSTQPHPLQHAKGVEITRRKPTTTCRGLPPHTGKLLRKEVIQPHLPVRLPCYDFVPIASPTFDDSPPQVG